MQYNACSACSVPVLEHDTVDACMLRSMATYACPAQALCVHGASHAYALTCLQPLCFRECVGINVRVSSHFYS